MSDTIIVALVSAGASIIGIVITSIIGNNKMQSSLKLNQAVTDTKLENLTDEVRTHNHFAQRMPVVEEQIKVINHRLNDLEESARKNHIA